MNKITVWLCTSCMLLFVPFTMSATLILEVQGHQNKQGKLHIAISHVKGGVSDELLWEELELVRKITKNIDSEHAHNNPVKLIIKDLPIGLACIRLYLDLNNNQLLERSSIGLPLEPVGFSNNPSLFKGEPSPQDSCFALQKTDNEHMIKIKQHKKRKRKSKLGQL